MGIGDLFPTSPLVRFLTVAQAWLGFSMLTLSISYLVSVYQAVRSRNSLAENLHALSGGSGDPRTLLLRLECDSSHNTELSDLRQQFIQLLTAHRQYPVVHYFVFPPNKYATVRLFFLAFDYASLRRALRLERGEASFCALEEVLDEILRGFTTMALPPRATTPDHAGDAQERAEWRRHFDGAVELLQRGGRFDGRRDCGQAIRRAAQPLGA